MHTPCIGDLTGGHSETDRFYRTAWTTSSWPVANERPDMAAGKLQVLYVPAGIDAARAGPTPIVWNDAIDDGRAQPATVGEVDALIGASLPRAPRSYSSSWPTIEGRH